MLKKIQEKETDVINNVEYNILNITFLHVKQILY